MEAEILKTLQEIRGVLYVITAIFFIGFSSLIVNALFATLNVKKISVETWKEKAIDYFDTEKYEKLLEHCREREISHKNDPNVYYWQARVYWQRGDKVRSKELFNMVTKVSPDWHSYVEPFINEQDSSTLLTK